MILKPTVFIGCSRESIQVATALQEALAPDAEATLWTQGVFESGRFFLEGIEEAVVKSDFAVFLWTPDDQVSSRGFHQTSARDNVVLETGLFLGTLGRRRVFILIPEKSDVKVPSDLYGLTHLTYLERDDGNYLAALSSVAQKIRTIISREGKRSKTTTSRIEPTTFHSLDDVRAAIRSDAIASTRIRILANRGLVFFGTDESVIPLHEAPRFRSLQKLRLILLSPKSRWINDGLVQLRKYESLEVFRRSLESAHEVVELALSRFNSLRGASLNCGVRYYSGEPKFRLLLTDAAAYVSSYGEHPSRAAGTLPVYRFTNVPGSLYAAFKRHFDDLWHNDSDLGSSALRKLDLETSAGGIVTTHSAAGELFYLLLQRDDGYWILPKGHRRAEDEELVATAIREVAEESGLPESSLEVRRYLGEYTFDEIADGYGSTKVVHLFHMEVQGAMDYNLAPVDHASARWFRVGSGFPLMRYSYQKSYLHELLNSLMENTSNPANGADD
jgi:8-oxo-dGTP pyrophosphatase MutT (NUDIX family)